MAQIAYLWAGTIMVTRIFGVVLEDFSTARDTKVKSADKKQIRKGNTTKVRNIKNYLLSALFNAPTTMGSYYQSEVNCDFAYRVC